MTRPDQQAAERAGLRLGGILTAFCALSLLVLDFPESAVFLLPEHGGVGAHGPQALIRSIPGHYTDYLLTAYFLFAGVPLSASLLAFTATRAASYRRLGMGGAVAAMVLYVFYFASTYHPGLLILAMIALVLAAMHLRELDGVDESLFEAKEEVESIQKRLGNFAETMDRQLAVLSRLKVSEFYKQFYLQIRNARDRVLSVERFWMMENDVWARGHIGGGSTYGFARTLERIRRTSALYDAVFHSSAHYVLFIGSMPARRSTRSNEEYVTGGIDRFYAPDDFGELMGLIYTMCVLEIARADRLDGARLPDPAGAAPAPLRVNCSIAQVPSWVKVMDDSYFQLLGRDPRSVWYEWHDGNRIDSPDRARAIGFGREIRVYDKNARRGYEHVCTKVLQCAVEARISPDHPLHIKLEEIVRRLAGGPSMLQHTLKHYAQENDAPPLDEREVDHLFELFFALHFRQGLTLTEEALATSLHHISTGQLWERSA